MAHSNDFALVTASRPAQRGELLSIFATGLGAVQQPAEPGQPFPSNPPAAVSSPVHVTVHGKPVEVGAAMGYPGTVDAYQINFRLPADTPAGAATISLSLAWMLGPPVTIAVR